MIFGVYAVFEPKKTAGVHPVVWEVIHRSEVSSPSDIFKNRIPTAKDLLLDEGRCCPKVPRECRACTQELWIAT